MERLDLSNNQLSGEISTSISSLSNLAHLDVSNNRFVGDPSTAILPLFNLKEISLGNNQFIFGDINTFLQNFQTLKVLDLAHTGLNSVPQKISSMGSLESLNLSCNRISKNFSNLSSLIKLSELNLSGNQPTKIPTELSSLSSLRSLDVNHNLFATNYAATLFSLKNLEWLSFSNNQITTFPTELAQVKNLVHLNFSDNKISGGVESLLVLKDLQQVYLDKNLFSGTFPTALLQLKKLQMISLTGNQLTGELPDNLSALTFLENNRFTKQQIKNYILNDQAMADFTYSPQRYDEVGPVFANLGASASLPQALTGNEYQFTWFKNLSEKSSQTAQNYIISKVEETDFGDYTCEAYTFEQLPNALMEISLFREPVTLVKDLATAETQSGLVVCPNPAIDFIHIKTTRLDVEKVFIFDLSGKLIMTETSKYINISHLPTGNYVLSLKTYDGIKLFKVIKK